MVSCAEVCEEILVTGAAATVDVFCSYILFIMWCVLLKFTACDFRLP